MLLIAIVGEANRNKKSLHHRLELDPEPDWAALGTFLRFHITSISISISTSNDKSLLPGQASLFCIYRNLYPHLTIHRPSSFLYICTKLYIPGPVSRCFSTVHVCTVSVIAATHRLKRPGLGGKKSWEHHNTTHDRTLPLYRPANPFHGQDLRAIPY